MSKRDAAQTASLSQLTQSLRHADVRLTPQRLEIYREILAHDDHPDAEAIYIAVRERMPSVSLDTVYRTLQLFVSLGLISTLHLPRERTHYDANLRPHHHFVCTRCGATSDFYSEHMDRLPVPEAVAALGQVGTVHVELRGLCSRCLEAERPSLEQSDPTSNR